MFWEGDTVSAQNLWRRFMTDHNMPLKGKKALGPKTTLCMGLQQSEKSEAETIRYYCENGFKHDWWWMDAGWYPCKGDWLKTGTWEADETRFPNGIKGVADIVHESGMELVLWFEPERVNVDSWLFKNHPEWLIISPEEISPGNPFFHENHLLDLGNEDALEWLIGHIDRFITENGIDIYRTDFNYPPLLAWRSADVPDRQGATENKYVCGLLKLWDEVTARHPGIVLDTCASGGRRMDLETLRRAYPLTRSDLMVHTTPPEVREVFSANQCFTYGLAMWIPYFGNGCFYEDRYSFLSHMAPNMGIGYNYLLDPAPPVDWDMLHDTQRVWHTVADNYCGDFYPLTPCSLADDVWMAWQFDRPEAGEGFVQAFRREHAIDYFMVFKLSGLDVKSEYEVTDVQNGDIKRIYGSELVSTGLTVFLTARRQAAVILYRKL
jgi:alpha-galactosidase